MRRRPKSPNCVSVFWWDIAPLAEDIVEQDPIRDVAAGYLQLSSCCVGLCLACTEDRSRTSADAYRAIVRGVAARSAAVYAQLYRSRTAHGPVRRRGEAYEALGVCLEDIRAPRRGDRARVAHRVSQLMLLAGQAGRAAHGRGRDSDPEAYEHFLDCVYDLCLETVSALAACPAPAQAAVR